MKTNTDNPHYTETLARYLSGEMSGDEKQDFENEISVSEDEEKSILELKKQWSSLETYKEQKVPDTRKAWEKLNAWLEGEKLIPLQSANSAKSSLTPNYIRVAAVVIILVGISAVIYLTTNRKSAIEMVQINTGNESNTLIKTLTDGSVIYIAQNSLFSFPEEFETESRNVELKGEAFFDITPNPDKPFIIETDEALIQVLGTAFNVKTKNGNDFELFVDRGKVKVTLKSNPSHSQFVVAGEQINSIENSLIKSQHIANQSAAWYRQRMHFKDEPLRNIINVLNRNFNTTFALEVKEVGNRRLTVTFHNETAETMTELLCVTLNLKSQIINGSVVLSENKESARQN